MDKQPVKFDVVFDDSNFRYIIHPLKPGAQMDIPTIFRVIKKRLKHSWRQMAEFAGLRNQSEAFRVAYISRQQDIVKKLSEHMVIDPDNHQCYFYDSEHKPAGVTLEHVGPSIKNAEATNQEVTEKIPTRVTSRVIIEDPLNRNLTMTLTPANGYLLGIRDISLANPEMTYVVTGSKDSLNRLLKQLHFVGVAQGAGNIVIAVNDNEGATTSISSTTITVDVKEGEKISVPSINLPVDAEALLNEETPFEPITVSDEDGKLMEFRMTPFGCKVVGFKNYLKALLPGEVRNIYGRPETINEDIANLSIVATQENAQIGVELICGKTRLREYLVFSVVSVDNEQPSDSGTTVPGPVPVDPQPNPQLPYDSSTAPDRPVAPVVVNASAEPEETVEPEETTESKEEASTKEAQPLTLDSLFANK